MALRSMCIMTQPETESNQCKASSILSFVVLLGKDEAGYGDPDQTEGLWEGR